MHFDLYTSAVLGHIGKTGVKICECALCHVCLGLINCCTRSQIPILCFNYLAVSPLPVCLPPAPPSSVPILK